MRYMLLPLLLLFVGCNWLYAPQNKELKEKQQSQTNRTVNTDIQVDYDPFVLPEYDGQPPVQMDILGERLLIPKNTRLTGSFGSKNQQKDWFESILTEKLTKKTISLLVIGALCIAGGVVLMFYGAHKLGVGLILFGVILLGCSFLINNYAWIFGFILILVLIGIGYVVWQLINKQQSEMTLSKIVERIEEFKKVAPEEVKKYILEPLAKDRNSSVIKSQVTRIKDA